MDLKKIKDRLSNKAFVRCHYPASASTHFYDALWRKLSPLTKGQTVLFYISFTLSCVNVPKRADRRNPLDDDLRGSIRRESPERVGNLPECFTFSSDKRREINFVLCPRARRRRRTNVLIGTS